MKERDEARAWIEKEFPDEKVSIYWFDEPRYLGRCIEAEKLNYLTFFRNTAWNDENINLYADYLKEHNIKEKYMVSINSMKLFRVFVSKGMLDNALGVTMPPSSWNEETAEMFAEKISEGNLTLEKLKNASFIYRESPIVLKGVLDAGRYDLLDAFDIYRSAWSDDNLDLLVSKITDKINSSEDINISEKILRRKRIYIGLLKNRVYDFAALFDSSLSSVVLKDPDAVKVIAASISEIYNRGLVSDYMKFNLFELPEVYLNLIENNIFDYVYIINRMGNKKKGLYDSPEKIKILLDAFEKLEDNDSKKALYASEVFDNSNAFLKKVLSIDDVAVASGYYWRISDETWKDEDIKHFLDKFSFDFRTPKAVKRSSYGLSLVLDMDDYSSHIQFEKSAWNKKNILQCCDNLLRDEKNGFYLNIDDPYYLYLRNSYFLKVKKVLKYIAVSNYNIDSNSLKNNDLLFSLGKLVIDKKVNYNSSVNQFLEFIHEVKSESVIYLIRHLIDDNLDNVDKLFDEYGMTDHLFNHLIFDNEYREYCKKNGIDFYECCTNKVHLHYLSFVSKYPELSKALVISPDNVSDYFDENGIKIELLEKIYRPGCLDLLLKIDNDIDYPKLDDKKLFALKKASDIESVAVRKKFFAFIVDRLDSMEVKDIENSYKIIKRIECSNSSEIRAFGELFSELVLGRDNPEEELLKIEKIFVQDKLPFVGKIFQVFKLLYPDYKHVSFSSNISPTLKNLSNDERDRVIFNDLLKIELGSNNRNLQQYLVGIFYSNMLYEFVRDGKRDFESLSDEEHEKLDSYANTIEYLCNTILGLDLNNEYSNSYEMIKYFEEKLREIDNDFTSIPNFLVKRICVDSGFNSIDDMLTYLVHKPRAMDELHRISSTGQFKLEKGDLVKGIRDLKYLPSILQNGSVAAEFLGDSSNSDLTPLDTDLSLVTTDGSINETLSKLIAGNYGPIYLVLKGKNIDRFDVTRSDDVDIVQEDKKRIEVFRTGSLGSDHYGIRTGFASSEIDFIIASKDYEKIGFEIALNGVYIPIVDGDGNLKFSVDDYERIRDQMKGLSYYGSYHFSISDNLISDEILKIRDELSDSVLDASTKRKAIYDSVTEVLEKFDIKLKTTLDSDLSHGTMEFFDTGSTGRGTNVANDSDFDFIVRVDRDLFLDEEKFNAVKKALLDKFGESSGDDFRLKSVKLDGIDEPLKVDMTFVVKTNRLDYATESCIQDRLSTIKSLYPEQHDLVLANIIFAKKFFKENGCYKPKHAGDNPQGGLGGVGTENWILQHGGSFYDAALDFVNCATVYPNLEEFQKHYMIQDFGKNHLAEKRGHYPYDNFVYNLNEAGFKKMKSALEQYVSSKKMDCSLEGKIK